MKKSIGILLIAALTLSLIPAATFAATDETVIVRYNQDDTTIGAGWSTNGKEALEITNHPHCPKWSGCSYGPVKVRAVSWQKYISSLLRPNYCRV